MIIKGIQKVSLIDYPGKICSIVFVAGCNMSCGFCQNPDLVLNNPDFPEICKKDVLDFLAGRKKWIDGVTITGGEPCIYPDLPDFIKDVKSLGFLVKLDTNGTNPEMLQKLIQEGLLDYIAMDIKGPLSKYEKIADTKVDIEKIKKSVKIIMEKSRECGFEYEFRTTTVPTQLDEWDFLEIGKWLKGAKAFYIQQFRPFKVLHRPFEKINPYPEERLQEFAEVVRPFIKKVGVRC